MRPSVVARSLDKMFAAHHNALLVGMPGVGKTDLIKQAAERANMRCLIAHPVVDDPTDYKGLPWVVDGEAEFVPIGLLRELRDAKEPTVFCMDDLGQAPPATQAAGMQLLLNRAINGIPVSDQIAFAACTNRKEDMAGVSGILEPVKSRFVSIIKVDADVDDWAEWAMENHIRPELIHFIKFKPDQLADFKPTDEMTNSPVPRTIANVSKILDLHMDLDAELELIEGAAGKGFLTEFQGFLQVYRNLPDPKKALTNPRKVEIPTDAMVKYALAAALSYYVDVDTMEAMCYIVDKLGPEYSVLAVKTATGRDEDLSETAAFVTWAGKHREYVTPQ